MAKDQPNQVKQGLRLKKIGNAIVNVLGGREIHPINVRIGGFYKLPEKSAFLPLMEDLKWAIDVAMETVSWTGTLPFPDFDYDYDFVSLRHPDEYPFNEGRIVSSKGLDIEIREYEQHFVEEHERHSNALHSAKKEGDAYLVGPLARYNLNFDRLTPRAQEAARSAGLSPVCRNPFQSIIVRAVELLYACEEALRILEGYEKPEEPAVEVVPRFHSGCGATEAPRGLLYHRYRIDERGVILDAKIVPPTSQNQKIIEHDLRRFVSANIGMQKDRLQWRCEQAVRNYDPCISCATHALKLVIQD